MSKEPRPQQVTPKARRTTRGLGGSLPLVQPYVSPEERREQELQEMRKQYAVPINRHRKRGLFGLFGKDAD